MATVLLSAAGPFTQAANVCFLLVGLFGDILLIRLFLTLAYIFLLTGAVTGYPGWAGFTVTNSVSVDGIIWSGVCLLLHGFALFRLLFDERRITFRLEDEEQLWRFFYRRSGMGRLEMKQVLKHGRWLRVPAGQRILCKGDSRSMLCLLVEGVAGLRTDYGGIEECRLMFSGDMWDLALCSIFGVYVGFEKDKDRALLGAVAHSDCLLYTWGAAELQMMATALSPAVAAFWRNFILCQLGLSFDWRIHAGAEPMSGTAEPERPEYLKGARSRDFTDPLRPYEMKRPSVAGFFRWLWQSLMPFLPAGMRHNALPVQGVLARNRIVAYKAAEAWAALSKEASLQGGSHRPDGSSGSFTSPSKQAGAVTEQPEAGGGSSGGVSWTGLQPAARQKPCIAAEGGGSEMVYQLLRRLQSQGRLASLDAEAFARELGWWQSGRDIPIEGRRATGGEVEP